MCSLQIEYYLINLHTQQASVMKSVTKSNITLLPVTPLPSFTSIALKSALNRSGRPRQNHLRSLFAFFLTTVSSSLSLLSQVDLFALKHFFDFYFSSSSSFSNSLAALLVYLLCIRTLHSLSSLLARTFLLQISQTCCTYM